MLAESIAAIRRSFLDTKGTANPPPSGSIIAAAINNADEYPRRGTREILSLYGKNPLLNMVASKVADLTASTNWRIGVPDRSVSPRTVMDLRRAPFEDRRRMVKGLLDQGELNEVPEHPFLDLLSGKNGMLLGIHLRKLNQIYLDLVGECYGYLIPNGLGAPVAMEPIPPDRVDKYPTSDSPFYRVNFSRSAPELIRMELIFCVRDLDPLEPYGRGIGKGRAVADELETDEYVAKAIKGFFRHGATPPFAVLSEHMSRPEALRAQKSWAQKVRDFRRQQGPVFFPGITKDSIHEFDNTFRDTGSMELRNRQRDFILQVFGISPEVFGIITNSNRSTIQESREILAEQVIIPRLEVWREAYQQRLLPMYDERLVVWYDDPSPENEDRKLEAMRAFTWSHTIDEQLVAAGLDPIGEENGGALRVFQQGTKLVGDLMEAEAVPAPDPVPPEGTDEPAEGTDEQPEDMPDEDQGGERILKAHDPDPYDAFEAALRLMEGRLAEAFREAIERMKDEVDSAALEAALRREVASEIEAAIPFVIMSESFAADYDVWSLDALRRFGQVSAEQLEDVIGDVSGLDLLSTRGADWARSHAAELVTEITEETRQGLRELVVEAFESPVSRDKLALQIRERIGLTSRQSAALAKLERELREKGIGEAPIERQIRREYRKKLNARAKLIARTETVAAGNVGQEEVIKEAARKGLLPPGTKKEWVVSPRNPCPICIGIRDAGPVDLKESFPGGYVRPPAHVACSCTVRTIVVEAEVADEAA